MTTPASIAIESMMATMIVADEHIAIFCTINLFCGYSLLAYTRQYRHMFLPSVDSDADSPYSMKS
jgi:hypothetical protein